MQKTHWLLRLNWPVYTRQTLSNFSSIQRYQKMVSGTSPVLKTGRPCREKWGEHDGDLRLFQNSTKGASFGPFSSWSTFPRFFTFSGTSPPWKIGFWRQPDRNSPLFLIKHNHIHTHSLLRTLRGHRPPSISAGWLRLAAGPQISTVGMSWAVLGCHMLS